MANLSLSQIRQAHRKRLPEFRNRVGAAVFQSQDGSEWTPMDWAGCMAEEVGEVLGLLKHWKIGDITEEDARLRLPGELADVMGYLDLTANRLGIDLAEAVLQKFNAISARIDSSVFLTDESAVALDPASRAPDYEQIAADADGSVRNVAWGAVVAAVLSARDQEWRAMLRLAIADIKAARDFAAETQSPLARALGELLPLAEHSFNLRQPR